MKRVTESPLRSVVKAFSWRIVATLIIVAVSFFITGKAESAFSIGAADFIIKLIIYYFHERAWGRISAGTVVKDS